MCSADLVAGADHSTAYDGSSSHTYPATGVKTRKAADTSRVFRERLVVLTMIVLGRRSRLSSSTGQSLDGTVGRSSRNDSLAVGDRIEGSVRRPANDQGGSGMGRGKESCYEVLLGPETERFVLGCTFDERKQLADCLTTELHEGPNARHAYQFPLGEDHAGRRRRVIHTALPLSFQAYVAVYRDADARELRTLGEQENRSVCNAGYVVIDILNPATGFEGSMYYSALLKRR
jgi:hypothetical protein